MKTKDHKKWLTLGTLSALFVLGFPALTSAQFIPCDTTCNYYDLLKLIDNIIDWIIKISIPVSALVLGWAGFTYLTTAISDKKSAAKKMIIQVFVGLVIILSAWIIVSTILGALLSDEFPRDVIPVELN